MKGIRVVVAIGLLAAAWLVPSRPFAPVPVAPVDEPSKQMRDRVAPVAEALRPATATDRAVWVELWKKAALVAASDKVSGRTIFGTTDTLREFNAISLNIAWRRLNGNKPGKYEGLAEATEAAFADTLGMESKPVTEDVLASYTELCEALAWAGSTKE